MKKVESIADRKLLGPQVRSKARPFLYVTVPKTFFDWIPHISSLASIVYCVVARMTWGYGKPRDQISMAQFIAATGLSRSRISKAIAELEKLELIRVKRTHRSVSIYEIQAIRYVSKTIH